MQRILFLSFYFEPDLCAGSFRNSPLAHELAKRGADKVEVDVVTTMPNRYASFRPDAPAHEQKGNLSIQRIKVPDHKSGILDQMKSFWSYFRGASKLVKNETYDLVYASSSRLFTAYLGYRIASRRSIPLYLDIRDIFSETMGDILSDRLLSKSVLIPVLRHLEHKVFGYANHINMISEGFAPCFSRYKNNHMTSIPHGIDDMFIGLSPSLEPSNEVLTITYAGNIGKGQGLEKIIPPVAGRLEGRFRFIVIGDGSTRKLLSDQLDEMSVRNVDLLDPMNRHKLMDVYQASDYLFVHLNDLPIFEKVLPSKIFELAAFDKPLIAGVSGFPAEFIRKHVSNSFVFPPGDVDSLVEYLSTTPYRLERRDDFIRTFRRDEINRQMAASILNLLPDEA